MSKLSWLLVLRLSVLVGLAASAALLSDYTADSPTFCGAASGCGAVRASEFSRVSLGDGKFVPLPWLGVLGFASWFLATWLSLGATRLAAAAGGLIGVTLLFVQAFVIQRFCWLCVTSDLGALVAALSAVRLGQVNGQHELQSRLRPWAWWVLAALALAAPLAWPTVKPAPAVPAAVLRHYQPNKINVVEFADFQCPACRRFAGILKAALADYEGRVHFVRLNKPLEMHRNARDAARAAVCAEAQSKAEPMADALFSTDDLTPNGIGEVARAVGLDLGEFERCLADAATEARVARESSWLVPPEFEGLPTTYIGGRRLLGVQSPETLADALERAARGEGHRGMPGYLYLSMLVSTVLVVIRLGWRSRVA